ncbi:Amino acid transporter [Handroanthus impetiginosus]|uniref:Amino acid transporter n=1 Tax=Handroanthus impetiginosus TaxID=429701 RepID=A0A2G9G6J7_9LAMI|nr:Amino acid transporter [Handroanthus impetiginosus]
MNFHHLISSSPITDSESCSPPKTPSPPWQRFHQKVPNSFKSRIALFGSGSSYSQLGLQQSHSLRFSGLKRRKKKFGIVSLKDENVKISKKKGSFGGAVALIIGTSIGSGILALPKKTSPAGLLPSSISMTMCWAFLLIEALLLVEINVGLLRKKKAKLEDDELEVISIRTMAQETLGEWGGSLATITFVFFGYTSMIAYCSKSGEILHRLTNFPESISGIIFTFLFTGLISLGGTRATDQVNQWLTASMIGLLIAIEVLAIVFGGWSGFEGSSGDWQKVPATLPVMIFALVYHDIAPVVCAYLGGDLTRIRASVLVGSIVPLLAILIWDAIALGLSNQADQVSDPVELLLSVRWSGVPLMVEAFSLLAVGTSLIGSLLSFSEFFKEQLNKLSLDSPSEQLVEKQNSFYHIRTWWEKNKSSVTATAMVVAPSLLVSTTVPDAFSAATDIAGGYCMTMLYGVLPPAMAWAMIKQNGKENEQTSTISKAGPALVGVGLFACGIVVEQILQDFSLLHP